MALDDRWFDRLVAASAEAAEPYYYLLPPASVLQRERRRFSSERAYTPQLASQAIDVPVLTRRKAELLELQADIAAGEPQRQVRSAYVAKLTELVATLDLLLSAANHDAASLDAANQKVYGAPQASIFADTCSWLRTVCQEQREHPDLTIRNAAKQLDQALPNVSGDPLGIVPPDDTFQIVKHLHERPGGFLDRLLQGTAVGQTIDTAGGDAIVKQVLANIGSDYTVMAADTEAWGVSHADRAVLHPPNYVLDNRTFRGVLVHEIGSHLMERVNGLQAPLKLLGIGLDHYEAGNEGRAYLREQIIYSQPTYLLRQDSWRHVISLHIGISLACGLAGIQWHFGRIYALLYRLNVFWNLLRGLPADMAETAAADLTWTETVRIMKGSNDGRTPYRKDIVYLEGNVRCWQIAQTQPLRILDGDLGKFDIANQAHVDLLIALGILPAEP